MSESDVSVEARGPRPFFVELETAVEEYRKNNPEYGKFQPGDLVSLIRTAAARSGNKELSEKIREEEMKQLKYRARQNIAQTIKP